jgi:ribosomal protein S18 acetylase RimI-like enzyme
MFEIRCATQADANDIIMLRRNAADWLRGMGTDQWQKPWPSPEAEIERLKKSIAVETTYIVRFFSEPVATFAIDDFADPDLWTEDEQCESALYIHRIAVHRDYSGVRLGAILIELIMASVRVKGSQCRWLRVDVWATNHKLQQYYRNLGFEHVRTIESEYPSGALFQLEVPGRTT